ncbi:6619_t:CDS:2 [Acaulospora colombiana]|uniref:6619_t:CDS:1 n=1 Tax=Acaulospora colombiana TaxID=27376 RepID=A0ACA9MAV5_9GLOM|nr:6619_t:CDS:2 [Acaulospora colombiana]
MSPKETTPEIGFRCLVNSRRPSIPYSQRDANQLAKPKIPCPPIEIWDLSVRQSRGILALSPLFVHRRLDDVVHIRWDQISVLPLPSLELPVTHTMYSIATFLQYATLLFLGTGVSLASIDARATCKVGTYGPFKLYASSSGPDGTSLLHLVDMTVDDNNNTISTLTVGLNLAKRVDRLTERHITFRLAIPVARLLSTGF